MSLIRKSFHVTLFGHLALEPKKILSKIDSERTQD